MLLIVITTVGAMGFAAHGWPGTWLLVATVAGMCLCSGGSSVLNHWYDRDIDLRMTRTANRPVAAGRIAPRDGARDRHRPRDRRRASGSRILVNWLAAALGARGLPHLRLRLHDLAEAPDAAEHRDRRCRGRDPAARRLGCRHGRTRSRRRRAVRDHLPVDAPALLGARDHARGRLRGGRHPDAAERRGPRGDLAPDHAVHRAPARRLVRPGACSASSGCCTRPLRRCSADASSGSRST